MLYKLNRVMLVGVAVLCVATARVESQDLPQNEIIEFSPALEWVSVDGYKYYIHFQDDAAVEQFQSYEKVQLSDGRLADIHGCSMGIDVTSGMADGQHSRGAICQSMTDAISNSIAICDDNHVGWFAAAEVPKSMTERELALFVVKNCVGG